MKISCCKLKLQKSLFHDFADRMPVIDYHCHLPVQQIADDINFENLTQIWLYGDHYKWRAMRTNGIDESYITGDKAILKNLKNGRKLFPTLCEIHCTIGRTLNCNDILICMNY